jgi:hypothetical protein
MAWPVPHATTAQTTLWRRQPLTSLTGQSGAKPAEKESPMATQTFRKASATKREADRTTGEPTGDSSARGSAIQLGFWAAILTVFVAAVFAAVGMATPARSGPFCQSACVAYPYVDVVRFIPGDYLWLLPGFLLAPIFVVLMACIHAYAAEGTKIFSRIGLSFAVAYAVVIMVNYFVQFTVVTPSLQSGETQDLSLFTQYNPHGLFIALEALAYLMMSVALLFAAPVFAGGRAERAIRGLLVLGFVLAVAAFVVLFLLRHNLVAFEVTVLLINWIVLIVSGALMSVVFRRALRFTSRADARMEV